MRKGGGGGLSDSDRSHRARARPKMADLNTPLAASAGAPLAMVDVRALLAARPDVIDGHLVLLGPDADAALAFSALVDGTSVDVCFAAGDALSLIHI